MKWPWQQWRRELADARRREAEAARAAEAAQRNRPEVGRILAESAQSSNMLHHEAWVLNHWTELLQDAWGGGR